MILLSHPTGNEFVRNALIAFYEAGLLQEFWTGISWDNDSWINKVLPARIRAELNRRSFPPNIRKLTRTYPWRECARLLSGKLRLKRFARHEYGPFSVDAIYRSLDFHVSKRLKHLHQLRAVYAYEDGAFHTFHRAHELGLKCIYELPIGYWRAAREIFKEEAELEPEWAETLIGNRDSNEKLHRKDEEIKLADMIIVPSIFVKKTLECAPEIKAPVKVIPFGAPSVSYTSNAFLKTKSTEKLRVLYVGILTQRKGLSYLIEAASNLSALVELTLIGSKHPTKCLPLEKALRVHRWIPSLPHHEILKEMRRNDVLVLPSLFEGFGLVILEAMSQGLPVIITPNTGGDDIVSDGEDGFIVSIRSVEAIAEKLELLARNKELLAVMSQAAQRKAAVCTWKNYRYGIVEAVTSMLKL